MSLDVHPAAAVWPMLPEDELRALADDIAANGLVHPIVITQDGLVLDGRNRLAACELAGVQPVFDTYDGDPAGFVLSANTHRRHMSTGARAMATALTLDAAGLRVNGRWRRGSVDIGESPNTGTWRAAMKQAGVVLDEARDLAADVIVGRIALDAAHRTAADARKAKRIEAEAIDALPDDLRVLVTSGVRTLDDAIAESNDRDADAAERERAAEKAADIVRSAIAYLANPGHTDSLAARLPTRPIPPEPDELAAAVVALATIAERTAAP